MEKEEAVDRITGILDCIQDHEEKTTLFGGPEDTIGCKMRAEIRASAEIDLTIPESLRRTA